MIKERIYRFLGFHKWSLQEWLARIILFIALSILGITAASAQEEGLGTEVVNIVKPYAPTVSDAVKIKQAAVLHDSLTTAKKPVEYEIFSVPVASTFTPARGKAADLEKPGPLTQYDNYASLGFGSYTSILAEVYSHFQISRTDRADFRFRHHSSQGGIDGVVLDNAFYDSSLEGHYQSTRNKGSYELQAALSHQLFNWYGLPTSFADLSPVQPEAIQPGQQYYNGYLKGRLGFEEQVLKGGTAQLEFLTDDYGSAEFGFKAAPEFGFAVSDLSLELLAEIDYVGGRFEQGYNLNEELLYGYLNSGIAPAIVLESGDLSLSLGAAAYLSLDLENSASDLFLYPRLRASYLFSEQQHELYGGVDGGLRQNSYNSFRKENPFVSPTLFIRPTSDVYKAYAGLKGKWAGVLGYNVQASYGKQEDRALFRLNPVLGAWPAPNYSYGNSFGLVYDDLNTLEIKGELRFELEEAIILGANAAYTSFTTNSEEEPWNLPAIQASLFSRFQLTDKLLAGMDLIYTGARKDLLMNERELSGPTLMEVRNLEGFFDANIELKYRLNPRLDIFAKGSNLVAGSYQRWLNFPVLGAQAVLGATYAFDW